MKLFFSQYVTTVFLFMCYCCFGQDKMQIEGTLSENVENDSIYFLSQSSLNKDYFEHTFITSNVKNDRFKISVNFSYPQLFRTRLKSETGRIPYRRGYYFFDSSTTAVAIDPEKICGEANGSTGTEFKKVFLPYFINQADNENNLDRYIFQNPQEFELKLFEYTKRHPNSYVALWFLISIFSESGYSELKSQILYSFSTEIKSQKLWKLAEVDFKAIRIKMNEKFPNLNLKDTNLQIALLQIPKAKFTLVDFWFSRCKPCLEQMPSIIAIYKKYNSKGFNVIGISSDQTMNIEIWNKRIIEKQIPWKNYLDENAQECSIEKIFQFPTNFLLDKNGTVIQKNIEPDQLEKFLKENIRNHR